MRLRLFLGLVLLGGLSVSGCSLDDDYAVTVTWLINGTAPSAALCDDQGVDRVRFTVLGPGPERVIEASCSEQLVLDDGYPYGAVNSTASFDYDTEYSYRIEMIDGRGRLVQGAFYESTFYVEYGAPEPWVLPPLELFSPGGTMAALTAAWTIERRDANPADCERLGATRVAIDVASSTDYDFDDPVEVASGDCAEGLIDTVEGVLAEGEYNVRYVALDADDNVVADLYLDEYYLVDRPGTLDLAGVDFDL
jgi:hypothetical protein